MNRSTWARRLAVAVLFWHKNQVRGSGVRGARIWVKNLSWTLTRRSSLKPFASKQSF